MTTKIRPELSKLNPYWISTHRFYELKHFCLQFPEWEKEANDISLRIRSQKYDPIGRKGNAISNMYSVMADTIEEIACYFM